MSRRGGTGREPRARSRSSRGPRRRLMPRADPAPSIFDMTPDEVTAENAAVVAARCLLWLVQSNRTPASGPPPLSAIDKAELAKQIVRDCVAVTQRVPTKSAIAAAVGVSPATLHGQAAHWRAFADAYRLAESLAYEAGLDPMAELPRGVRTTLGDVEAFADPIQTRRKQCGAS